MNLLNVCFAHFSIHFFPAQVAVRVFSPPVYMDVYIVNAVILCIYFGGIGLLSNIFGQKIFCYIYLYIHAICIHFCVWEWHSPNIYDKIIICHCSARQFLVSVRVCACVFFLFRLVNRADVHVSKE